VFANDVGPTPSKNIAHSIVLGSDSLLLFDLCVLIHLDLETVFRTHLLKTLKT
jgi:hypothetical protein